MQGLKDHQIAKLVNEIRDELKPICEFHCLRELIVRAVMRSLEEQDLRIDKPCG